MRILHEDTALYKGIFWITDSENLEHNRQNCFLIPVASDGSLIGDYQMYNSRNGNTYNHERTWAELPKSITQNKPFNYFPRGRVEISNGKATIYLSPHINTPEIREFVQNEFNLTPYNGISKVIFHSDGSNHYKCYLDNASS